MGRLILRLLLLFSLAGNAAFLIHFLTVKKTTAAVCPVLELSRQERKQMNEVHQRQLPAYNQCRQRLHQAREELLQVLRSDPAEKAKLAVPVAAISAAQNEMLQLTVDEILQCKRFLSPSQCRCLLTGMADVLKGREKCPQSACCPSK